MLLFHAQALRGATFNAIAADDAAVRIKRPGLRLARNGDCFSRAALLAERAKCALFDVYSELTATPLGYFPFYKRVGACCRFAYQVFKNILNQVCHSALSQSPFINLNVQCS